MFYGSLLPAALYISYHSCLVSSTSDALQISFRRKWLVVPTTGWILAGCLRIHATAIAELVTPLIVAISLIVLFST